ncbi:hypothetical protein MP228_000492 [Amoeboaphelidium protococcarum]|nr:hypothetical protein MP228_000492 [Amoeboaphelidium protococcarum]
MRDKFTNQKQSSFRVTNRSISADAQQQQMKKVNEMLSPAAIALLQQQQGQFNSQHASKSKQHDKGNHHHHHHHGLSSVVKAAASAFGFHHYGAKNNTADQSTYAQSKSGQPSFGDKQFTNGSAEILKSHSMLDAQEDTVIDSVVGMDIDLQGVPTRPHPLYIPEILLHILSFLESPMTLCSDPNQPLDFVKVDSVKYTISKPKLHSCALVSKLWNQCAVKMLYKNVKVGNDVSVERLARTLGSSKKGGQIGRSVMAGNVCWGTQPETCQLHEYFVQIPSPVNGWIYGQMIKSIYLTPSHGSNTESFMKQNLDFLVSLVAISCPQIESLTLSNCSQITDRSMVLIAKHCRKLKILNLNRCDLVSTESVEELARGCTKLEVLNLSRPLMNPRTQIADEAIAAVVQANPNLKELRLRNCERLSDDTVIKIAQSTQQNLLALDLSWCSQLTDRAIVEGLGMHCKSLKSLALNGCKRLEDGSLRSLLTNCPNIASLSLAHLPFISDQVLTAMAVNMKHLQILSLNGCARVGDASITAIVENCNQLQCLSLFQLPISDVAVEAVANNCPDLVSLSISGCVLVTDNGAIHIQKLRKLQSLYLNGAKITDISLVMIASQCRQIRALSLNDCQQLTDKTFVCLSKYCPSLQSLSMNKTMITVVGIKALVDRCIDLKELSVKECQQCTLIGPDSQKLIAGNGGMHSLCAVGDNVLSKIRKRRIALICA